MIVGGSSPLNRVNEVLQRMQDNLNHVDALKTCCGILAILSRDEANKLQIARDGIRLIVLIMESHIGRPDLLEASCDLLWSLAFNNTLVKDVVGRHGAVPIILKGPYVRWEARWYPIILVLPKFVEVIIKGLICLSQRGGGGL